MEVVFLDLLDVLEIHETLVNAHGGSQGIRDLGALLSAIAQPQSGFEGQFFHEDVYEMAAAYLFHIVKNHPFLDGNKRTSLASALIFLDINNIEIDAPEQSLYEITMAAAEGKAAKAAVANYFRSIPVSRTNQM